MGLQHDFSPDRGYVAGSTFQPRGNVGIPFDVPSLEVVNSYHSRLKNSYYPHMGSRASDISPRFALALLHGFGDNEHDPMALAD